MKNLTVGKNEAGQRFDKLLFKYFGEAPKSFVYKMLRKKNITLNDKKCEGNEILSEGDVIKLWLSDETIDKFMTVIKSYDKAIVRKIKYPIPPIIYEDDDILIFNKPAGLLSQKAEPDDISVNELLLQYLMNNHIIDEDQLKTFRPSICNRLDRNTSGLIICGKSLKGLQTMAEALKHRTAHKDYIAVVKGKLTSGDSLQGYINKDKVGNLVTVGDEGDYIETQFKPIYTDGNITYVMVRLITGKTHQIRAHMASIGHPLVGDRKYGDGKGAKRQLLHAYMLTLPDGNRYIAPLPEDMKWELGNPEAFEDLPWKI